MIVVVFIVALDLTPEGGGIYPGQPHVKPAQCILSMEDKDIIDLKTGKLNPEMVREKF